MRKIHIGLMLAIFLSPSVFANHMHSKACAAVGDACKKAGYTRDENGNKKFWQDCMKPVVMGKTVKDVTVDPLTVKQCRMDKIHQLKTQLKEFEETAGNKS